MKYSFYVLLLLAVTQFSVRAQSSNFKPNALTAAVVVTDSEKSLHFYKDILGLQDAGAFDIDAVFAKRLGLSSDTPFHVDLLKFSDTEKSSQLKIVSFKNNDPDSVKDLIQQQLGLQYLTLEVYSLNSIMENVKKEGIKPEGETPLNLGDNRYLVLLKDPDGVFVEIIGDYKE